MRRVLFVCPNLAGGGAERQWSLLVPGLAERGFAVSVLTLDGEGPHFETLRRRGVEIACAGLRSRWDLPALRRAIARGVAFKPDVVVTRSVSAHVAGALVAKLTGARLVANERTDFAALPLRRHQRALVRLAARTTDAVVAVAEAQVASLRELGFGRVEVIPNAAPPLAPARTRAEVRRELGLSESDFVALLVANLRPETRVEDFVDAVAATGGRVRGLVAGDGSELDRIRSRANGSVRVLGRREDVPDLMAASDAVCLTSATEASPNVLLEAMALARPVVATAVGGVPEIVVDRETGLLVPPARPDAVAAALLRLAEDRALAERLGLAGLARHRERYSLDGMLDSYAEAVAR